MPESVLGKILEAARLAPSAKNLQPWRFVIVREQRLKEELAEACFGQGFIAEASAVFVCIVDPKESRWTTVDAAIALEHMVLQAVELGYGSCWIGAFDEKAVKSLLGVPEHLHAVAVLPIGIPAERPSATPRKLLEEIAFFEKFGEK
jgi:nitroreductase